MANHQNKLISTDNCFNCGRVLRDDWFFCPYCHTSLEIEQCTFCKKEIKKHWEYCPHCKNKIKSGYPVTKAYDDANRWLNDVLGKIPPSQSDAKKLPINNR